jgi:selenocysteine-specific elongation factor
MRDGIERESARAALSQPALFDDAVAGLLADGRLAAAGNTLCMAGHSPAPSGDAAHAVTRLADLFTSAGLEPPELPDLPDDLARRKDLALLIRFLERDGTLVRMSPVRLIDAKALSSAAVALRTQVVAGEPLDMADVKRILGLTRKHLIPLLEHFDRTGVTRRTGETRVVMPERSIPADA